MRYKAEQKEETRQAIVEAAGRLLKTKGFDGIGVDGLMAEANLTSGAFYKQFSKKTDVLLEVVKKGFEQLRELMAIFRNGSGDKKSRLQNVLANYLSLEHRREVAKGCLLPSLSVDVARAGDEAQKIYEKMLFEIVDEIEPEMPDRANISKRQQALATIALMAGGVMLARALPDGDTASELLEACRVFGEKGRI